MFKCNVCSQEMVLSPLGSGEYECGNPRCIASPDFVGAPEEVGDVTEEDDVEESDEEFNDSIDDIFPRQSRYRGDNFDSDD